MNCLCTFSLLISVFYLINKIKNVAHQKAPNAFKWHMTDKRAAEAFKMRERERECLYGFKVMDEKRERMREWVRDTSPVANLLNIITIINYDSRVTSHLES